MKAKIYLLTLFAICSCAISVSATNLTVKMNSVSQLMTMKSKTTGQIVEAGSPDKYIYNFDATPGEYVLTGYAKDGTTVNGTIEVCVGDSATQQITVLTLTAYATNRDEDGNTWVYGDDYTLNVKVNSREGVNHPVTIGNSTTAGRKTFLALNGDSFYAEFAPAEKRRAEGYVSYFRSNTLTGNINVSASIPKAEDFVIKVPKEAEFQLNMKFAHFVDFTPVNAESIVAEGDTTIYNYRLALGQVYNYRTRIPGKMTLGGYFTMSSKEANRPKLVFTTSDYEGNPLQVNHSADANQGYETGDIFVNINPQGHLKLRQGDTFKAHAMRTWQLTDSQTNNYFIEPEFHYTVIGLDGKPDNSVISIESDPSSAWADLKAIGQGTVIVLVTYDAIKLNMYNNSTIRDYMGGSFWGAIWPENTAAYVVTVGGTESSVVPNMMINEAYNDGAKKLAGKYVDSEHDVFYYLDTEEGAKYTFKPEGVASIQIAYPTIGERMATYTGFSTEGVTRNDDGTYTLLLKHGRQIVRLTDASGNSTYQVMTAKKCHREIINATRADSKIFQPGDNIKIQYSGLFHPANKLAGIYNMSAYVTYNGVPNGSSLILGAGQYTFGSAPAAQAVTVSIPSDHDVATTPEIKMTEGVIQVNGFGDPIGNHRNIDAEAGRSPNFTAIPHKTYFGYVPELSFTLSPYKLFDIRLENHTADAETEMKFGETVLEANAETGLYSGTYGMYDVVARKKGYRCYRNTFNIADDAEGLQTFKVEMEQSANCWDGETLTEPASIDGVYQISTGSELAWFANEVNTNTRNLNAVLTADIDLGNYDWTPIGNNMGTYFSGTFLGGNHRVRGLYINDNTRYTGLYKGLFGYVKGESEEAPALISGIEVDGQMHVFSNSGGIAGYARQFATIESCVNHVNITGDNNNIGGIVGYAFAESVTVKDCCNTGNLKAAANCGGILGCNGTASVTVENVYNIGKVNSVNPSTGGACVGSTTAKNNVRNAYAVEAYKINDGSVIVTDEQMASGEVAFALGAPFGQTIGTDAYPVLNGKEVRCDKNFNRYYNVPEEEVKLGDYIITAAPNEKVNPVDFWKYGVTAEYGVFGQIQKNEKGEDAVVMTLDGKQIGNALTASSVMLTVNPAASADNEENSDNRPAQYLVRFPFLTADDYEVAPGLYEIKIPAGFFTIDGAPVAEFTQSWIVDLDPVNIEPLVTAISPNDEFTPEETWNGSLAVMMSIDGNVKVNSESASKVIMTLDGKQIGEALAVSDSNVIIGGGDVDPLADEEPAEPAGTAVTFLFLVDEDYKAAPGVYKMTIPAGFFLVNGAVNLEYTHTWTIEKPEVIINRPSVNPAEGSVNDSELRDITLTLADGLQATAIAENSDVKLFKTTETGLEAVDGYKYNVTLGQNGEVLLSADEAALLPLGNYRLVVPAGTFSVEDTESPEFIYIYVVTSLDVDSVFDDNSKYEIFTVGGMVLKRNGSIDDVRTLAPGLYIINGKRVMIRK